jgi:hypothetical protein
VCMHACISKDVFVEKATDGSPNITYPSPGMWRCEGLVKTDVSEF